MVNYKLIILLAFLLFGVYAQHRAERVTRRVRQELRGRMDTRERMSPDTVAFPAGKAPSAPPDSGLEKSQNSVRAKLGATGLVNDSCKNGPSSLPGAVHRKALPARLKLP